jgi:hypothetical protein
MTMKNKILAAVLGAALLSAVGCGGQTVSDPSICAMNPIAYGCNLESTQGAVADGFNTASTFRNFDSYVCDGFLSTLAATIKTDKNLMIFGVHYWETEFLPVNWANPLPTRNSFKSRTANVEQGMTAAMDGPYHVLYNPNSWFPVGLVTSAAGNPNLKPVIIPPYGVWIYAPNERPDYPNGVEVVTMDPDPSVPFVAGDGRCTTRQQFVVPL